MTEAVAHPASEDHALPRPGWLGRVIRLVLGIATLALLQALVGPWRSEMWAGRLPLRDVGFWVVVCLALWGSGYVFNIAFGLSFGERTRIGLLLGAAVAAAAGFATGQGLPSAPFGAYLWTWFVALTALLGVAHLLAAALATPGCEMRSYMHLGTRLRGGDVNAVTCPGGVDRWDHVGVGKTP